MQTPKKEMHFLFSVCCIVFTSSWQLIMLDKKQESCVNLIHLVTDDGLYDRKAFYTVRIYFTHPLWMMANLSIINILRNGVANIYIKLKSITSKLHNTSVSIAFIKKALFVDVITNFAMVKGQSINETDSLIASRKSMKSYFNQAYSRSLQFVNTV